MVAKIEKSHKSVTILTLANIHTAQTRRTSLSIQKKTLFPWSQKLKKVINQSPF